MHRRNTETLTELCQRYETGWSIRQLAVTYHYSYGTIRNMLRECGIKLRARGGANHIAA